jgi:hypothetical protein
MTAMKVALGPLARSGIESELNSSLADTVRAALEHYRGKLESGRPPLAPPRIAHRLSSAADETVVDLSVDPETEAILKREARAQGLDLDRLAAHSVLVYLAELDFLTSPGPPL